jgi:hypothetical protein
MKPTIGPVEFIDRVIKHDEKGEPFSLAAYQRRVLEWRSGVILRRACVTACCALGTKKSGKAFMAACLALWWAVTNPHSEIIITANDLEQSVSRVVQNHDGAN